MAEEKTQEIYTEVRGIIVELLGVDEDKVTMDFAFDVGPDV